ncbi:MAG: tetratricopeptide repeat protein [Planctomycetes bacterium]|nr:tetratricopeptide repeat protein [Planctomycetota bacterium]
MKTYKAALYTILTIAAVAFAITTFLYGGSRSQDPHDSPLYDSTLQRAFGNFKTSHLSWSDGAWTYFVPDQETHALKETVSKQFPGGRGQYRPPPTPTPAANDRASQFFKYGIGFFQKKQYDKALIYFGAASSADPTNVQSLQYLVATYSQLGQTDKAQEATRKLNALQKAPPARQPGPRQPQPKTQSYTAKDYLDAGMRLYNNSRFRQAIPFLDAALKLDRTNLQTYYSLANCYYAANDLNKMVQYYKAAVEQAPDNPTSNYYLGVALSQSNKPEEAAAAFNKTLELDPNHIQAHEGLGKLLKAKGKIEEAMKQFQYQIDATTKLIADNPRNTGNYNELAQFYLRNNINITEGLRLAEKAIEINPDDPPSLATAAQFQFKLGNKDKAIELIDKAIAGKAEKTTFYQMLRNTFTGPPAKEPGSKEEKPEAKGEAPSTEM